MEAFVNVSDLYKSLSDEADLDNEVLDLILTWDRAEILDEYIRLTGTGIDVQATRKDGETEVALETKNKLYLGLSIHGKKRTDLARKNDPNAVNVDQGSIPLLWKAALVNALGIVRYLAGDRPLAAYRFYAAAHSGAIAQRLRSEPNLDTVLPQWLGWSVNSLNESPLAAAILGSSLEVIETMFAKFPRLMASSLHERCVS